MKKIKLMSNIYGKARTVFSTGAMAHMAYQTRAIGATQSEMKQMRTMAVEATGKTTKEDARLRTSA